MEIWTSKPSPRSSSRELIASESEQGIQKYWSKYLMKNSFFPYSSTLVMKIITAFSVSKFKLKTYHVSSITIVFMANQSARIELFYKLSSYLYTNGQTLSNKDILLILHFYRNIDSNPLGPTLPSDFFAGFNKMELL